MENTLRNIRLMTAVERNLCVLPFRNLIMDIWDLLGCDYEENTTKVNNICEHKDNINNIITELQYEFQCNQLMKYNESDMYNYLIKNKRYHLINNWEFMETEMIVKSVVEDVIVNVIKPTIDKVLSEPLEEVNYKIND